MSVNIKATGIEFIKPIAIIVCFAVLVSTVATASDLRVDFVTKIDSIAEEAIQNGEAPGVSIALAEGAEIIYAKGFGFANLTTKEKATANHIYRLASVTKQFTAAAVMQLVDSGKIDLNEPITTYFPEFSAEAENVTVTHLLQHTSGMAIEGGLKRLVKMYPKPANDKDANPEGSTIVFGFEAGSQFQYSNVGYYMLGVIIEKVSGQRYADYLKEHIFEPVGMNDSGYGPSDYPTSQYARGYRLDGEEFKDERKYDMSIPFAAGGLVSTVGDLVLWQRALISGEVVSPESYKRMRTTGVLNSGKRFNHGFGLFVGHDDGLRAIKHAGKIMGFSSATAYYSQRDITLVVLTNLRNGNSRQILNRIEDDIF